jgi:hypothetical protein
MASQWKIKKKVNYYQLQMKSLIMKCDSFFLLKNKNIDLLQSL